MKDGTYNEAVYLPDEVADLVPRMTVKLNYSRHAQQAALNDRYGLIRPPMELDLSEVKIIEITIGEGGCFTKAVVRWRYTYDLDIVFVLKPKCLNHWFVKTIWGNRHEDQHTTLDASKFVSASS